MKKRCIALVAVLFAFAICASTMFAAAALPDKATSYVTDAAGVLDAGTKQQLVTLLSALEKKTTAQVVVVTVGSLDGDYVEHYTNALFHKWGIGQKGKNNGVMLLAAIKDRKMRIEVGYGLEGVLNDAKAGAIRDQFIKPKFKEGNYAAGITDGTVAIVKEVVKEYNLKFEDLGVTMQAQVQPAQPAARPAAASPPAKPLGVVTIIIIIGVIIILLIIIGAVFMNNPLGCFAMGLGMFLGGSGDGGGGSFSDSGGSGGDIFDGGGGDSGGGGASGDW
jgi:uncharacterized protein